MIANGQSLCKAKNKTSSITIVYKKCEVVYSLSVLHVMHMHTARPVVSVRMRPAFSVRIRPVFSVRARPVSPKLATVSCQPKQPITKDII